MSILSHVDVKTMSVRDNVLKCHQSLQKVESVPGGKYRASTARVEGQLTACAFTVLTTEHTREPEPQDHVARFNLENLSQEGGSCMCLKSHLGSKQENKEFKAMKPHLKKTKKD